MSLDIKKTANVSPASGITQVSEDSSLTKSISLDYGLHKEYPRDTMVSAKAPTSSLEKMKEQSGLAGMNFWKLPFEQLIGTGKANNAIVASTNAPISSIPVLEVPEPKLSNQNLDIPLLAKTEEKKTASAQELQTVLSLMSEKTVEQIVMIALKAQLEIEKDLAVTGEQSFTNYQKMEKIKVKMQQEVKEALEKDAKVAKYLKGAAIGTAVLAGVCALVAAAATAGVAAPLGAAIGGAIGGFVTAAIGIAATVGPIVAGVLSGLVTGTRSYNDYRTNEDKANLSTAEHLGKHYNSLIEDARERLTRISESDGVFKEHLIELFKRHQKMINLILQN